MARYVRIKVSESSIKSYLNYLIDRYGSDNYIDTFQICSENGIFLYGSTIDRIVAEDGDYKFYYNVNEDDFDTLSDLDLGAVFHFALDIKKACSKKC